MSTKSNKIGIHWFRRDLRLFDNPNLRENISRNQGRVVCFFILDPDFIQRKDIAHNRFAYLLKTLAALKQDIKDFGGELFVIETPFAKIIQNIAKQYEIQSVSWEKDYEPYALKRDKKTYDYLNSMGIEVICHTDHLILPPEAITPPSGGSGYYKVFTAYYKKWLAAVQERATSFNTQKVGEFHKVNIELKDVLEFYRQEYPAQIDLPPTGLAYTQGQVRRFRKKLKAYDIERDYPAKQGNSGFSHLIKNGQLSTRSLIHTLDLLKQKNNFIKELAWRDFYYYILFHVPHVCHKSFNPAYEDLQWENNSTFLRKWKEGQTGFPIVDAAMRELTSTGHMHNRCRMIVASFLTKDLLIDWKKGELFFMQHLLDGDLASNNGGWQWAASTGCDAQPYFRIFNPWTQSKRFDPEGVYIKKFIPELADVDPKKLHAPILGHAYYPEPIVDHSIQRVKALKLYKQ